MNRRLGGLLPVLFASLSLAGPALAQRPMTLEVNAHDAARRLLHARLTVPVKAPGKLTLLFPEWIPGEHGPTGPIADLAIVKVTAAGKSVPWRRDDDSMFAFHLEVPAGADTLVVDLDFLEPSEANASFSAGSSTSARAAVLSWNHVLLYPKGARAADLKVSASLRLPVGWRFGTALPQKRVAGGVVEFETVSLETLIDSPVAMGAHARIVPLATDPPVRVALVGDSEAAVDMPAAYAAKLSALVSQALALFGARHFKNYTFLLTLSDRIAHFGLEHHESSDNRVPEEMLSEPHLTYGWAGLLPHEMVHSWNGKYRRPSGLNQPSYAEPHHGELLWVYEGLTEYLGDVLTARSGLWDPEQYREMLAFTAARMEHQRGRDWRPLADTAVAAQVLYGSRDEGAAWRRGTDFYPEGELLWLEVDATIRRLSPGKSLDDFCRAFFGGESGAPKVVPYKLEDVLAALGQVASHDWTSFFHRRVDLPRNKPPLEGLQASGWKLVYTPAENKYMKAGEEEEEIADQRFDLGLRVHEPTGRIPDVIPGSAADRAGVAPGMKLLAVNGRKWSKDRLRQAVREAKKKRALELIVENGEFYRTVKLDYAGGERYPHLERDPSKPDLLTEIIKARGK
jgi:predicted metalloprotease with PDZ domain